MKHKAVGTKTHAGAVCSRLCSEYSEAGSSFQYKPEVRTRYHLSRPFLQDRSPKGRDLRIILFNPWCPSHVAPSAQPPYYHPNGIKHTAQGEPGKIIKKSSIT